MINGHLVEADYPPIGAYAVIGDCRSAALISRDGSLDWLGFPRFDSPSLFGALLDARRGGRFRVRPTGPFRSTRRYLPDTNVLETSFTTSSGTVVLRDLMPVTSEEDKQDELLPAHEVLREIEGQAGEVEIEVDYEPRPDYGQRTLRLQPRGALGLWGQARGQALILESDVPLTIAPDGTSAHGTARIRVGERAYLSFSYSKEAPAVIPPLGAEARRRLERSVQWWHAWAARCRYGGPYRAAVVRSALTLKLLTYAPSGAVLAAPTTSLPEKLGGVRNWDYRYCWLRDASLTVRALLRLGYHEEAEAFVSWMLHTTRVTWPGLQVLYDVFGVPRLPERELPYLEGYAGSRPVRIGNDAHGQLQLDVYGEMIDAVAYYASWGGHIDGDTARMLDRLGRTVCERWREPDEGIWEGRAGRFDHTHSKVLCWVALDRLLQLHGAGLLKGNVDQFRAEREAIRAAVEAHGYNERLASYTRLFDDDTLDASLLLLPHYGYVDGTHPRMRATCERIRERLARGALVYRYQHDTDDGLPVGEGAFGICSFWAVECLARGGDRAAATQAFEELLGYANDLDLYAEEIDPVSGAALGNFPQAFTHVGLINAALTLGEGGDEVAGTAGQPAGATLARARPV